MHINKIRYEITRYGKRAGAQIDLNNAICEQQNLVANRESG